MAAGKNNHARVRAIVGWLVAPVLLVVVLGTAVALVREKPVGIFGAVLTLLLAVPILWIFTSALWPGRADRTCPACKSERLARMSKQTTTGLVCRACGWEDEHQSSWFLAEEEGPLEKIVMEQRRPKRTEHAPDSAVDSAGAPD